MLFLERLTGKIAFDSNLRMENNSAFGWAHEMAPCVHHHPNVREWYVNFPFVERFTPPFFFKPGPIGNTGIQECMDTLKSHQEKKQQELMVHTRPWQMYNSLTRGSDTIRGWQQALIQWQDPLDCRLLIWSDHEETNKELLVTPAASSRLSSIPIGYLCVVELLSVLLFT